MREVLTYYYSSYIENFFGGVGGSIAICQLPNIFKKEKRAKKAKRKRISDSITLFERGRVSEKGGGRTTLVVSLMLTIGICLQAMEKVGCLNHVSK